MTIENKNVNLKFTKTFQDALIDGYKNPSAFCRDFLDVDPYKRQEEVHFETRDTLEVSISAANRTGKSHWLAQWGLWRSLYQYISPYAKVTQRSEHVGYKTLFSSMTIAQSKIAYSYALKFAQNSPRFKSLIIGEPRSSPFPEFKIETRTPKGEKTESEIWARSLANNGEYILGESFSGIGVDECAYIRHYEEIENNVIRMRLADQGGSIARVSSPNSRNFFYSYYVEGQKGNPAIKSFKITTWENPYISREYLRRMKERLIPEFYLQNVLGEFVSLSDFFPGKFIGALYENVDYDVADEIVKIEAERGKDYVIGIDLGAQRDPTVIIVVELAEQEPHKIVFLKTLRNPSWRKIRSYIVRVAKGYQPAKIVIDATGNGGPVAQQLIEEDGLQNAEQFIFSPATKPEVLTRLQDAVQSRRFIFPFCQQTKPLVEELSFYKLDDKKIHQDHVIAFGLVNYATELLRKQLGYATDIPDYLAGFRLNSGTKGMPEVFVGDSEIEVTNGTTYRIDEATGLFLPEPADEGGSLWGLFPI